MKNKQTTVDARIKLNFIEPLSTYLLVNILLVLINQVATSHHLFNTCLTPELALIVVDIQIYFVSQHFIDKSSSKLNQQNYHKHTKTS